MAIARNINGLSSNLNTTDRDTLWELGTGVRRPLTCSAVNCTEMDAHGAHVQGSDGEWYVVMLCEFHNSHKGDLVISDKHTFVPARKLA